MKAELKNLLLKNARVVLPDDFLEASVLLSDGKIAQIDVGLANRDGDEEIDLSGMRLFPGFIDLHNHGSDGIDVMTADVEAYGKVGKFLAAQGVTGWLPTLVPASNDLYVKVSSELDKVINAQSVDSELAEGAQVLGVHYEGPFVNSGQCGALHKEHFKSYSGPSDLELLQTPGGSTAIKMITVAPEIEGGIALVSELKERGWIVSVGHTRADVNILDMAFSAGARHMTHFMNAMSPLHQRSPGPVGWGLSRDDVTCDVIADGIHLDSRILRLLLKVKTPRSLILISDAIAAAGLGDGDYEIWGETISVTDGRTSNAKGSIAGSVITMLRAVRLMLSMGVSESDVARMSATNPAMLIGVNDDRGSIEVGKRADLVAIDGERNACLTIIGGRVVFRNL